MGLVNLIGYQPLIANRVVLNLCGRLNVPECLYVGGNGKRKKMACSFPLLTCKNVSVCKRKPI